MDRGKIKITKGDLYGGFRGKVSNLTSHHNTGHERGLIGDGELDEEGGKGRFKGKGTGGKLVKTGGEGRERPRTLGNCLVSDNGGAGRESVDSICCGLSCAVNPTMPPWLIRPLGRVGLWAFLLAAAHLAVNS